MWCCVAAGALTVQMNTDGQFVLVQYDFSQGSHEHLIFSPLTSFQYGGSLCGSSAGNYCNFRVIILSLGWR